MTDAALIAGLRKEVSDLQDRLQFSTKAIENREETISKLNARLDDQAAQIVDLQGKLDLAGAAPARPGAEATIKRLAKIEEDLRWAAERSEARVRQLEDWARENELNAPIEAPYYRPKKEVL